MLRSSFIRVISFSLCFFSVGLTQAELPLNRIQLPPGFKISIFASEVENARSMAWNGKDTLYVGTRHAGNVYALVDIKSLPDGSLLLSDDAADVIYRISYRKQK